MNRLYKQMLTTAENAGINIIGIERAAQIMATVYLYGDESTVYSEKLRTDITHICRKYGLYGGRIPDADFISKVKKYSYQIRVSGGKPVWLKTIENSYRVVFPKYKKTEKPVPGKVW